jgi:hypothetical protein
MTTDKLLTEDSSALLQENGSYILLNESVAGPFGPKSTIKRIIPKGFPSLIKTRNRIKKELIRGKSL